MVLCIGCNVEKGPENDQPTKLANVRRLHDFYSGAL